MDFCVYTLEKCNLREIYDVEGEAKNWISLGLRGSWNQTGAWKSISRAGGSVTATTHDNLNPERWKMIMGSVREFLDTRWEINSVQNFEFVLHLFSKVFNPSSESSEVFNRVSLLNKRRLSCLCSIHGIYVPALSRISLRSCKQFSSSKLLNCSERVDDLFIAI